MRGMSPFEWAWYVGDESLLVEWNYVLRGSLWMLWRKVSLWVSVKVYPTSSLWSNTLLVWISGQFRVGLASKEVGVGVATWIFVMVQWEFFILHNILYFSPTRGRSCRPAIDSSQRKHEPLFYENPWPTQPPRMNRTPHRNCFALREFNNLFNESSINLNQQIGWVMCDGGLTPLNFKTLFYEGPRSSGSHDSMLELVCKKSRPS